MIDLIKKLFRSDPPVNYSQLVKEGALIVDVRSKGEYAGGHIRGSVNIPVDQLSQQLNRLPKDKVIITCCASGMRSATARGMLQSKGYPKVHNGGGWHSLQSKLS
jgi:rhodanese-related sulfurtransferase